MFLNCWRVHQFPFPLSLVGIYDWTCSDFLISTLTVHHLSIVVGLKGGEHSDRAAEMKDEDEEQGGPKEDTSLPEGADPDQEFSLSEVIDLTANTITNGM